MKSHEIGYFQLRVFVKYFGVHFILLLKYYCSGVVKNTKSKETAAASRYLHQWLVRLRSLLLLRRKWRYLWWYILLILKQDLHINVYLVFLLCSPIQHQEHPIGLDYPRTWKGGLVSSRLLAVFLLYCRNKLMFWRWLKNKQTRNG